MFPLVLQIPGIGLSGEKTFVERLEVLARHRFMGIEYQASDFGKEPADRVKAITADFNLKVTRIATGALAMKEKLSLSEGGGIGEKTLARMKDLADYASEFDAGLILGFIKGAPGQDREKARHQFVENLSALAGYASQKKTPFIIEATNHHETSLAFTLAEAAELADAVTGKEPGSKLQILPDTYHMNIEETDIAAELCKYIRYFEAVHLSDNNRCLPGYGAIDFKKIFAALIAANFSGYIGLEGNFRDFARDIALCGDLFSVIERGL